MKKVLSAALLCCALAVTGQEDAPRREMTVRQGPETVFDRPPAEIIPALAGATATGENGRVGTELVFWGYEQAGGQRVFFFACAKRLDFDCATRVPAICPAATTVLETRDASGTTVRRSCRNVATIAPGDTRPGCIDQPESADLTVGLVSCG
jgi:hypothetical protein